MADDRTRDNPARDPCIRGSAAAINRRRRPRQNLVEQRAERLHIPLLDRLVPIASQRRQVRAGFRHDDVVHRQLAVGAILLMEVAQFHRNLVGAAQPGRQS